MPGRVVPFVPDCYYHIYNRGNNRGAIFFEPENYIYFLHGIKKYLLPAADVIAYCLMPTHYHLMIRVKPAPQTSGVSKTPEVSPKTPEVSDVSLGMMRLSVSYTKAINKRFGRSGVLFQGRFQARAIADSGHLIQLCCYIHGNPVKDGLVTDPARWPYSNYLEWIGERQGTLLDCAFVHAQFPDPGSYKDFVRNYLQGRNIPEAVQTYLGDLEA
ncbi:MAG TPA: transposase [Anaerolineales bacterium]